MSGTAGRAERQKSKIDQPIKKAVFGGERPEKSKHNLRQAKRWKNHGHVSKEEGDSKAGGQPKTD